MAKKARTPPPPRKVQAPKQRHTGGGGLTPERKRSILWGAGGAVAIALIVVLIVVFTGGKSGSAGNPSSVRSALAAAGCTLSTSVAAPSAEHISSLDQTVKYSTYPPVSGRHYVQPAIWGNYSQAVDPRQAVHNEEHGGIVIWVGPGVTAATRKQISDFYDESPNAMLVTPIDDESKGTRYPAHAKPDSKVYMTAWTTDVKNGNVTEGQNVIATCPRFGEKAFTAFRDEFRGTGPERFAVSSLTPGT